MASTNGIIFPESMADFLANPVDICFGSVPLTSTAPATCLVIKGNVVTTHQQIETDLSKKTHPPTPSNLIAGIDRVGDMLSDTIKVCEHDKRPRTTPSTFSMAIGLRNAAHVASRYMKRKIQIQSGLYHQHRGETDARRQERENTNAARAVRRQEEIAAAAPGACLKPANAGPVNAEQVNTNARQVNPNAGQVNPNVAQQAPVAPAAPQQRCQDDPPRANGLRARDLLRDLEHDGLEVYNSLQINLGSALAILNHLEDSSVIRCLQANVRVAAAQIEERGPGYSGSRSECPRQRCRS
jgi:hypothetical protein